MGFEPTTASLEGWNSTTELRPPAITEGLSRRQSQSKLARVEQHSQTTSKGKGFYPVAKNHYIGSRSGQAWYGGQARVRTLEAIRQQIYSLPPLSTWVPARPTLIS